MVHDFKFHFHNFHVEHDHVEVCHLKVSRKLLVNLSICNSAPALVYILKAVAYSCLDASAALSMKNVEASQTFHLARAVSPGKSCVLPDLVPAFSVGLKMFHLMLGKSVVFLNAV